ncbi:YifB family Mg chelatase-like AAA ATPase [Chitinimonas koreensis]|uniref:YifB family Mg chelatase-like AAA ATPase n=1 Tax=Chitinimonas koreensis TaxID=356302 RepID=UPI000408CD9C|nr:YifB family Mg chelatase-like AAA ATPase [Chitinimonas koreensis]QNM96691.1 YifB family Mg chelatase-like AAA ATPase [Chitinimonas koreensis]
MSLAVLHSRALNGVTAPQVVVEAHLANGLPGFTVVGLPDAEVKEARDRVRAAIQTARFEFPARRITVNLAPADLPKDSGRFDLPIALGILAAAGQIPAEALQHYEFAGELALTGELRPVRGALAMSLAASRAGRGFILPQASAAEAALIADSRVHGAESLSAVCAHLAGHVSLPRSLPQPLRCADDHPDLADVKGQQPAKRALEIAAAGGHSLLMVGPPGTGKSMLAARLPGLLPAMGQEQALEAAALQSLGSQGFDAARFGRRSFRQPHHTASAVALVGGGPDPRPGEISLAHHGVLFLDELPEFDRKVLEVLREPLENRRIVISRAARQAEFPAAFLLVAAMNPCPCGYRGHPSGRCRCTPDQVARYVGKLSGPLLDRIDLIIEVPAVGPAELAAPAAGEPSARVRARVDAARARQLARQGKDNARLGSRELDALAVLEPAGRALLDQAMQRLDLSARAYHRILRVARTIADLAGQDGIGAAQLAEAIQYRRTL